MGVFESYESKAYPFLFEAQLHVPVIAGGVPSNPKIIEGWLKTKIADKDELVRQLVAETMVERGLDAESAVDAVADLKHLNGFKRDDSGLYIEGRQMKAALKEAANVRWPGERWGPTRKGTKAFFAEHLFVTEDRVPLGVSEPSDVVQRFVHGRFGAAIQNEEVVRDAKLTVHVETDHDFTEKQWAELWITAEHLGIGASRSQGYGRFEVTSWERVK